MTDFETMWGSAERSRARAEARQVQEEGRLRDTLKKPSLEDVIQLFGELLQDDCGGACDWDRRTGLLQGSVGGTDFHFYVKEGLPE